MRRTLAALSVVAGLCGPALAETMGYADAISILAKSCGADIEKYCPKANLANFEIGGCLQASEMKLVPQCTSDMVRVRQAGEARAAAQATVRDVCGRDIQRLCPPKLMKLGEGHVLNCLVKAKPSVSERCNIAITDAGYR